MPRFTFTVTGDIEAINKEAAERILEKALERIDPNAEVDVTEQEEEDEETKEEV